MKKAAARPICRGVAIPTALFIVLVLFSLITITVFTVNQNVRFTYRSHYKTQAYFLAKAADNKAIYLLSTDPGWEAAHTGQTNAYEEDFGNGMRFRVWLEQHPLYANLYFLRGEGLINANSAAEINESYDLVVKKEPEVYGTYFARKSIPGYPDVVYYRNQASDWTPIPPVPRMRYDSSFALTIATPTGIGSYATNMTSGVGDQKGNFYGVWRLDGIDTLYKYSVTDDKWISIYPPAKQWYDSSGVLQSADGPCPNFHEIATDGTKYLYARFGREGIDTIYRCNLETATDSSAEWSVLPAAPRRHYDATGALVDDGGIAGNLCDLDADGQGNLICRNSRDGIDTIYRYSESTGQWGNVPPVPKRYYTYQDGAPVEHAGAGYIELTKLSLSKDGILYGRWSRDNIDTIYRFPARDNENGWGTIPPSPYEIYNRLGDLVYKPESCLYNFDRSAVNGNGVLALRYPGPSPDAIITIKDVMTPSYETLPPVPRVRYGWNDVTQTLDMIPQTGYESLIDEIGGGGIPTGMSKFVVVSSE